MLNTDAEGRLVLADVLAWAVEEKPAAVIDLATLTGAILVALGPWTTGLFSNDDALAAEISDAARICDRFVLLSGGRVRGEGTLDELKGRAAGADLEEVFLALT